jgi:hypothetical protein
MCRMAYAGHAVSPGFLLERETRGLNEWGAFVPEGEEVPKALIQTQV